MSVEQYQASYDEADALILKLYKAALGANNDWPRTVGVLRSLLTTAVAELEGTQRRITINTVNNMITYLENQNG